MLAASSLRGRPLLLAAGVSAMAALMLSAMALRGGHPITVPRPVPASIAMAVPRPAAIDTGIASRVAPGNRAFAIRVAEDEIVGGFLQSGDHIDIFATLPGSIFPAKNAQDQPDRSQTILLLQDIAVLAVGETLATKGAVQADARTVSLSLDPPALARLALAQRFGKISLAIRRPGDDSLAAAQRVTLADLAPVSVSVPARSAHRTGGGIAFYAGTKFSLRSARP